MAASSSDSPDALVVGAGPNGLAAAIEIARSGRSVRVLEAADEPGGGTRSAELTLPGHIHDVCSAVHPFGIASRFFSGLPLHEHGLEWVQPDLPTVHPLDGGRAAVIARSLHDTDEGFGAGGASWRRVVGPTVRNWAKVLPAITAPVMRVPRNPVALARFGLPALLPASRLIARLDGDEARAAFAGMAAHAAVPLERPLTASFGLALAASAHTEGWPVVRGGSGALASALVSYLESLGGVVETDRRVTSLDDLPRARAVLLDVSPVGLLALASDRLPRRYLTRLGNVRYGPGVCKVDYALTAPVPWDAAAARRAGTVHVGGTFEEVAAAEADVAAGRHPERPFVLVSQPSVFDDSRAPAGRHTLWAYCHVPNGSTVDMTGAIEAQIERFAPGFGDLVAARHTRTAADYARYDANFVGGDIATGSNSGLRAVLRPAMRLDPYRTPAEGLYLCSAATPPGGGVHGMCGYWAARSALRHSLR